MSMLELLPAVHALSRREKFELAQLLLQDLSNEEPASLFKEGQTYPIHTPQFGPDAASHLAAILKEEPTRP